MNRILSVLALAFALTGCAQDDGPTTVSPSTVPYFQRLTNSPEAETSPRLSPDGTRVAYERSGGIRILDLASRTSTLVVPQGSKPDWTKDGSALVFVRRDVAVAGLIHRLMKIQLSSGALDTLSADSIDAYEPAVSRTDDRIVLRVLSRQSLLQSLRVLSAAGEPLVTLTSPGTWTDMTPGWSQEGRSVVFVRLEASGLQRLSSVPSGGGNVSFASAAGDRVADPAYGNDGFIYLSKDGVIAVSRLGEPPHTLIHGDGYAQSPTLSVDRTRLVFTTDRVGNRELWMLVDPNGIAPSTTYEY